MACVAEKKAIQAKTLRVAAKKKEVGRQIATANMQIVIRNCMASVHFLLVENMSINGLQNGRIIHGRERSPVQAVISGIDTPISQ